MDLPKEKINSYNKIFQEKFSRDDAKEEIFEIERDLKRLAKIMYESYMHHKKLESYLKYLKKLNLKKSKYF